MRVSEEAADHIGKPLKRSHVTQHSASKLFATPDRVLADSMVLQVVPDVFAGIQIWGVQRQEKEPATSLCRSHELKNLLSTVRRMAVDDQKDWAECVVDEALEKLDEILRVHSPVHRLNRKSRRGLIAEMRFMPKRVFTDNGSEFSGRMFDLWAYHHGVRIDFSRPGKPTDNCFIESFNGSLRDECLNVHWFESMEEARARIEAWRIDYNENRPHQALQEEAPAQFAMRAKELERSVSFLTAEN
jgi:hypothetical protein